MQQLIVPLGAAEATDPERFGPKAANLARLGRAGLPIPGGFCVDAEAYRIQVAALGLGESARGVTSPDLGTARRAALAMKLGLLDRPIVPEVLEPLREAWQRLVDGDGVHNGGAFVGAEPRIVFGSSFAGQFESYLGLQDEDELVTAVRSCWAALWSTRVLRYMATRDASTAGHGDGSSRTAACVGTGFRRRPQSYRRWRYGAQRHVGPWIGDCPG